MEKGMIIAVMVALCLVVAGAEGKCTVKNTSRQALVIVPVDVTAAVEVVVEVGASVVLESPQQHCYLKNKKSGHKKGPVQLNDGGVYAIVDATVAGQVNLCAATLLGVILNIGVVILGGI